MRADTLAMRDVSLAWVMPDQSVRTVGTGWKEQREYLAHQSSRIGDLLVGTQPLIKRPRGRCHSVWLFTPSAGTMRCALPNPYPQDTSRAFHTNSDSQYR